jgi:2-polyprenyl-6-methoxyphenol hydroxylase-like FAD-dependent oxidoreductase
MASTTSTPLIVVVSGGGPVGLTFSLNLAMMMGEHVKIIIYEGRWFVDEHGIIRWRGKEQDNTRREQVVTLQDHVIEQMPSYIRQGLFQNINERVWPTSKNIPIQEVEDRLFDLIQPFVQNDKVELIPEELNEKSEHIIKGKYFHYFIEIFRISKICIGNFDVLVGADGSNSFVRRYWAIPTESTGIEYACGVAYNIPEDVPESDKPLDQALNCILTISQTRYLVNSSKSHQGFLNIRLKEVEYEELKRFQSHRNRPLDLLDYNDCPQSPALSIVRQGLEYFKIAPKYVYRIATIVINVRRAINFVKNHKFEINKEQSTKLACLVGDSALNVHFWPGRGMNSGMKAAMALARNIVRLCTSKTSPPSIEVRTSLRPQDFGDYAGFMAKLCCRELEGRSNYILDNPIDKSVEQANANAHSTPCYRTYITNLRENLRKTRDDLQNRRDWLHTARPVTDAELELACNRIHHTAVAQLSLANRWPTREMSGDEIRVETYFPFNQNQFLPVPAVPETGQVTFDRQPSHRARHRFLIVWFVGDEMSEKTKKLIDTIRTSPNFADPSSSTAQTTNHSHNLSVEGFHKLQVVPTIKKGQKWIEENRGSIQQEDTFFKVITAWSLNKEKTALNVIQAVRSKVLNVPVLIYMDKREEIRSVRRYGNVIASEMPSDVYEFVGIDQETQWNPGCHVCKCRS